jgi:hypothetical protein
MLVQADLLLTTTRAQACPATAARLLALASRHLRPEHGAAAMAYSRTTYFDTPDLSYYRSSSGTVKRRLRVREYAVPSDADEPPVVTDGCFLELKQSAGNLRTKTRLALQPGDLPRQLAALTDAPLAPCVATLYRRRALIDAVGQLRVTLDDRLMLCRPRPIGSPFTALDDDDIPVTARLQSRAAYGVPPPGAARPRRSARGRRLLHANGRQRNSHAAICSGRHGDALSAARARRAAAHVASPRVPGRHAHRDANVLAGLAATLPPPLRPAFRHRRVLA